MNKALSVSEITKYIGNMFKQDFMLSSVKVTGEVSNCKYHGSGHIYFTLKDDKSSISCIMFASNRGGLGFQMADGDMIEADGHVDIYEKSGSYQLYVKKVTRAGAGELYLKFEALKKELEDRGMFAPEYKRPIPRYIHTLGVVTASTGAAVQDIINVASRRNPYVQIILYPAKVQGDGAVDTIVEGINELNKRKVDVMIVGRGGGSIEDLWAFNEEVVAQAIFDSEVPVISAVGHETDFTIADFVSDYRAPTPSAAAEVAVYEISRIEEFIASYGRELQAAMYEHIRTYKERYTRDAYRLKAASPQNQLLQKKTTCVSLEDRLNTAIRNVITDRRHKLEVYITTLKGLSPLEKLNQGYSVAVSKAGNRMRSVSDVQKGDMFKLYMSDGYILGRTEDIHGQN